MNCQQISKHLYNYCEGKIAPQLSIEIQKHLEECESCHNNYKLTLLENHVLSDITDIPPLSDDFTEKLMKSIRPDNDRTIPTSKSSSKKSSLAKRFKRNAIYVAAAAVILLAVYISLPDIMGLGNNIKLAQKSSVEKIPANIIALNENNQDKIENRNINSTKLDNAAPEAYSKKLDDATPEAYSNQDNNTVNSPDLEQNSSSSMNYSADDNTISPENTENLQILGSYADVPGGGRKVMPEVDRSGRSLSGKEKTDSKIYVPVNIPEEYKLHEIISTAAEETIFNYVNSDSKAILSITIVCPVSKENTLDKLIAPSMENSGFICEKMVQNDKNKEKEEISAAGPKSINQVGDELYTGVPMVEETDLPPVTNNSTITLNKKFQIKDQEITIILSGDLSPEELAKLATIINIKEEINHDQN